MARAPDYAEVLHAEHHAGTFVPDLDSCVEHKREFFERLAARGKLPELRDITRWEYKPGDRLIARVTGDVLSREQAQEIAHRVRWQLQLPENAPIVIAGENWTFEVLSSPG